jgi:hypothetical protein
MAKAPQQLVAAVMMHDRFADDRAEMGHAIGQPGRHAPAMQRQVGAPGSSCHRSFFVCRLGHRKRAAAMKPI